MTMGTMNFSVPDEVKDAFNEAFKHDNKSAIVVGLLRRAIELRAIVVERGSLVDEMMRLREASGEFAAGAVRRARERGRP